jgi:hypothetical protein
MTTEADFKQLTNEDYIGRCQGWIYPSRMQCQRAGEFVETATGHQYCAKHYKLILANVAPPLIPEIHKDVVQDEPLKEKEPIVQE